MRYLTLLVFSSLWLFAFEHKSELSFEYFAYEKYEDELAFEGDTQLKFENDFFNTALAVEYLYSSEYNERRYILLNELYLTKEYEEYSFSIGKSIKYWGELEGFNIADVYNQKNYLLDPFDKSDKLGSLGMNVVRYFDENSLELGVKLYEEDIKYPSMNSPYNPFAFSYKKSLQTAQESYTPTLYLNFSFITDESVDSESKIILLHGYDNKRYFVLNPKYTLSQYAYRVNKLLFLSHILYKDAILKCEGSYTDVIEDEKMSDYAQLSAGVEKNFYDIASTDFGVYFEYYRYIYTQEGKIENVDISEIYNDDLFLALKINLNDTGATELKGGILYDLSINEEVFKIEAKSRVMDTFMLHAQYLQINTTQDANTLLSNLGNSKRFTLGLSYTF